MTVFAKCPQAVLIPLKGVRMRVNLKSFIGFFVWGAVLALTNMEYVLKICCFEFHKATGILHTATNVHFRS